jgi:hypothetical protein
MLGQMSYAVAFRKYYFPFVGMVFFKDEFKQG